MESSGRSSVEKVTSGILPGNGRGNGGKRDGILRQTKTAGTVVRKRDGMESYDRLKLPEPLSGNVPETASVSDDLILWTEVTGLNRNRSSEPLVGS